MAVAVAVRLTDTVAVAVADAVFGTFDGFDSLKVVFVAEAFRFR